MTKELEKDSDDEDITVFKCKICNKEDKCQEGRYVCAHCEYAVHIKCANKEKSLEKDIDLDKFYSSKIPFKFDLSKPTNFLF